MAERTIIKICGITNMADGLACSSAGADELGFNFFSGSPRFIDPHAASEVAGSLSDGTRIVGVFVNETLSTVLEVAAAVGLHTIQLHGDEPPEYLAELKSSVPQPVIRSFRVGTRFPVETLKDYNADAVLLDSYSDTAYGGTGESFDWTIAASAKRAGRRIYLAGGLNATNVREAIEQVRPYAVDACSGLESQKGRKDPLKVREFIRRVREADEV